MDTPRFVEVRCPARIDRSIVPRRSGWSGDPASRFTSCNWRIGTWVPNGYARAEWSEYPNGPDHPLREAAGDALRKHLMDHDPVDFIIGETE